MFVPGAEVGTTNSALIDISGTTPQPSKRLWAFAHFSRFIRPGAVRIETSGSGPNLQFSAFKNLDGTVSVQILNSGSSSQNVTVVPSGFDVGGAKGYLSEQGTDFGVVDVDVDVGADGSGGGGEVGGSVPGHAMVTFVLEA